MSGKDEADGTDSHQSLLLTLTLDNRLSAIIISHINAGSNSSFVITHKALHTISTYLLCFELGISHSGPTSTTVFRFHIWADVYSMIMDILP